MCNRRCRIGVGLLAVLMVPALLGPAPADGTRPRNLVLITLDTMRADRLTPYGFAGVETHALDRLAASGALFEQAFAAVPLTLPSHASLFTGLYPPRLGVRDNASVALAPTFETIAEVLNKKGLATAAFVASGVLANGRGLEQGFGRYSERPSTPCLERRHGRRRSDEVVSDAIAWLDRHDATPFFVWLHLYDTHKPYQVPDEYLRRYADPYLAAIAFQDAQLARMITRLERRNVLAETLLVVVGDHGESLGDHGEESHGLFIYQEALHVPLIIHGAAIPPRRVRALTRLVDVMPTVLELFGVPSTGLDGVSLAPLVTATHLGMDPRAEVYAESLYPQRFGWAALRSLRADRYKVVDAPRPELYDLASDPREGRNVFAEYRQVGAAMLRRLRTFDDPRDLAVEPRQAVATDLAARLSSLGYVAGTPGQSLSRAGGSLDPKDHVGAFNRITRIRLDNAELPVGDAQLRLSSELARIRHGHRGKAFARQALLPCVLVPVEHHPRARVVRGYAQ